MSKLFPSCTSSELDGYAQCVSNTLQHEAESLLRNRTRPTSASDATEPLELSDTVLEALDLTMHSDGNSSVHSVHSSQVVIDDNDSNDGSGDDETNDVEPADPDDSITLLKQPVASEPSTDRHDDDVAQNSQSTVEPHKCCESCTVNRKSKKKLAMVQCSVCMSWYHEQCVGLDKNSDPMGIWLCLTCTAFPKTVTTELSVMRNELSGLKQSTTSILTAVKALTSNIEGSIGNINDRITAINKQISGNDKGITGAIQHLTTTTNNIKTSVDQKACQTMNKTSAVLDKVKTTQIDLFKQIQDTTNEISKLSEYKRQVPPTQNSTMDLSQQKTAGASENAKEHRKQHSNKNDNGQNKQNPTRYKTTDRQETIDLTQNTKTVKTINHATLITGSSLLKNVNTNQLNTNTTVMSFPGATIDSLKAKLSAYNLDQCKTVMLLIGGNDADNGTDIETFAQKYESLLTDLMTDDRRVIVVGLLPRKTVNLGPFNDRLKTLCESYEIEYVDNFTSFLIASSEIPDSYFQKDKVHLNNFGLRRLLSNIDSAHSIMSKRPAPSVERQYNARQSGYRRPRSGHGYGRGSRGRQPVLSFCQNCSRNGHETHECRANGARDYIRHRQNVQEFCHICLKAGHDTLDCWFNGRSNGRSDRNSR